MNVRLSVWFGRGLAILALLTRPKLLFRCAATMLLVGLIVAPAKAADPIYTCQIDHVLDGDTVKVFCPDWPKPFQHTSLRVFGIDTPESRKPPAKCLKEVRLGLIAKAWLKAKFAGATKVDFVWANTTDKWGGRIDAFVFLPDGKDVAQEQIRVGNARPYDGKAKSNWCQ